MHRRKSAALWGAVGLFVFLVAAQGAMLVGVALPLGFVGVLAIGVVVGAIVALSAYLLEHRLARKGQA